MSKENTNEGEISFQQVNAVNANEKPALLATQDEFSAEIAIPALESDSSEYLWRKKASYLFKWHVVIQLVINATEGVIPCLLVPISEKFKMSAAQQGLLGGLYYITWACSSPFVGHLIKLQGPHVKQLYLGCILLTITASIAFALLPSDAGPWSLILVQAASGIFVSAPAVIGAVWVNTFTPQEQRTSSMGLFQSCMVLGAGFGYGLGALLSNVKLAFLDPYQVALLVIAGMQMGAFWILFVFAPEEDFDINAAAQRIEGDEHPRHRSVVIRTLMSILCNIRFMLGIITMSILCFIVRGIQYYATAYFIQVFKANPNTVYWTFFGISTTSPLLGLALGSSVGDCIAEYFDEHPTSIVHFYNNAWCCVFGCCSAFWSCIAAISTDFVLVAVALWFCLFFGSALIPLLTVTILEVLPVSQRPIAQGLENFLVGIVGYGGSLIGLGLVAELGMRLMWKVLLHSSWVCLTFLALMTCSLNPDYGTFAEET